MGVSLGYISSDTLAADIQTAVKADAERINEQRRWWCEPLSFFQCPDHENKLAGATKLFLPSYSTDDGGYVEVDPADDCFMAARDAQFIIEQLARWSGQHDITWRLELEGSEIGSVANGEVGADLMEMVHQLPLLGLEDPEAAMMETGTANLDDDERAAAIDQQYASRWE